LDNKFNRTSTLIALGGGVVGDIAGFAAATFMRGINFIQVPTTLLSQVDSSVGGKVGVDFEGNKNIIGSFYQPKMVYINVNTLKTLPLNEMKAGLAEVIKHAVIDDAELLDYVDYNITKILECDEETLQYMIKTNCSIKSRIVEQDEKETELRANLNFGHTIGHAIESIYDFKYLHGECVSLGMVSIFKLARYLEMVDEKDLKKLEWILEKAGLPTRLPGIEVDKVFEKMSVDKKRKSTKMLLVLPRGIGEVIQISMDQYDLIKKAISYLG
jgi:3-dehydroquinate synthase